MSASSSGYLDPLWAVGPVLLFIVGGWTVAIWSLRRRDEVTRITKERWSARLRFETASGRLDHVVFGAAGVAAALRELGWPVD